MRKTVTVGQLTRLIRDLDHWAALREGRNLNVQTLRESIQHLEEYRSIVVIRRHQQQQTSKVG